MKKLLSIILMIYSANAFSLTADELRAIAGEADKKQREKAGRVNVNDLNSFLPETNKKPAEIVEPVVEPQPAPVQSVIEKRDEIAPAQQQQAITKTVKQKPQSTKYKKPDAVKKMEQSVETIEKKINRNSQVKRKPVLTSPDSYVPPPRKSASGNKNGNSDVVLLKQRRFGIPLGTWIPAKLIRQTTNSDPGLIELITTKDMEGKHKILPVGTFLFSEKRFNAGTKRLDLHIVLARLPGGIEIELDCLVYDGSKVAGLQGIIVENNSNAVESGFKSGLVSAGQSLVEQGTAGTVTGTILSSTTHALANTQQASIEAAAKIPFTVHVSPQSVQVQVQTTF